MLRTIVFALVLVCVSSYAVADPVPVLFDFEDLPAGLDLTAGHEMMDPVTGLRVTISRTSFFGSAALTIDNIAGGGAPPAYGFSTVSPFLEPGAPAPVFLSVDTSMLDPSLAGYGVESIHWQMGDAFPGDEDIVWILSNTVAGPISGYLAPELYQNEGAFSQVWLEIDAALGPVNRVQREDPIQLFGIFGGTNQNPNSLYYDNFVFSLQAPDAFTGDDLPISTSGGGNQVPGLGDDFDNPPGAVTPIPEPGTLVLLGLGLAGLALRRRRR